MCHWRTAVLVALCMASFGAAYAHDKHALSEPAWSLDYDRMLRRAELLFLPSPWAWYVCAALYAAYVLYICATCALLWARRKHYMLRKTPVIFPLASAACQLVLVTTHFARYLLALPMPPCVAVWRNYVFFPLTLMFGLVARGMHVCFAVLWTRSLAAHWAAAVSSRRRPSLSLRPDHRQRALEGASAAFASSAARAPSGLGDPALLAFMRRRLTHIVTGALAGAHVLIAAAIHAWHWPRPAEALDLDRRVHLAVELAGIVFAVLVYGVASSLAMLWALRGVRDAYGLRHDLKSALAYALPLYLLYTLSRWYCSLHVLSRAVPAFLWMLAALLTLHTATAVHPVLRTFRRAAYRPFVRSASLDVEDVPPPEHSGIWPVDASSSAPQMPNSHSVACLPIAPNTHGAAPKSAAPQLAHQSTAPAFARRFSVPSAERPAVPASPPRRSSLEGGDSSAAPVALAHGSQQAVAAAAANGTSSVASVQESDEGSRSSLARRLSRVPALDVLGIVPGTRTPVIMRHRPIPLATILENEHLAAPFEAYTRRAFVYDTIVFYRMVQSFHGMCRERAERLGSAADVSSDICPDARYARARTDPAHADMAAAIAERPRRLSFAVGLPADTAPEASGTCCCKRLRDAAVFIYDYFVRPRSPCEMNLTPATRLRVTRALFPDDIGEAPSHAAVATQTGPHGMLIPPADAFDAAVEEVLCNVGQCTYRNFLYALGESQPELKARYLVPVGRVVSPANAV